MSHLQQRSRSPGPDEFPTAQLVVLAMSRLAEPIALTSVYPYCFDMMRQLTGGDDTNAAFYAGLFISVFSLAESMTCMSWGSLSDKIGRKPVLLLGCAGTIVSLLAVGLAPNIWIALLGRAMGGFLNGNIGVAQTIVAELVTNPAHEARAYAIMPLFWSIGTAAGPAIGGTLACPSETLPSIFSPRGIFGVFPYLLPNLVCSVFLLITIMLVHLFLKETHPHKKPQLSLSGHRVEQKSIAASGQGDSYGTIAATQVSETSRQEVKLDNKATANSKTTFTKSVSTVLIAMGILSFHTITYVQLLPVFLQDEKKDPIDPETAKSLFNSVGGLGLTVQAVGVIQTINGILSIGIEVIMFPLFTSWLGARKVFLVVTILHPIAYFMVPYLAWLPKNWLYTGVYICTTTRSFFCLMAFPAILILLKRATPSSLALGKINGLAASVGAACRTIAPPLAGYLYSIGSQHNMTALAWWASGMFAMAGTFQCWFIHKNRYMTPGKRRAEAV